MRRTAVPSAGATASCPTPQARPPPVAVPCSDAAEARPGRGPATALHSQRGAPTGRIAGGDM